MDRVTPEILEVAKDLLLIDNPFVVSNVNEMVDLLKSKGKNRIEFIQWLIVKKHPLLEPYFNRKTLSDTKTQIHRFLSQIGIISGKDDRSISGEDILPKDNILFWKQILSYYNMSLDNGLLSLSLNSHDVASQFLELKNKKPVETLPVDIRKSLRSCVLSKDEISKSLEKEVESPDETFQCVVDTNEITDRDTESMKSELLVQSNKFINNVETFVQRYHDNSDDSLDCSALFDGEKIASLKDSFNTLITAIKVCGETKETKPTWMSMSKQCDELWKKMKSSKNMFNSNILRQFDPTLLGHQDCGSPRKDSQSDL